MQDIEYLCKLYCIGTKKTGETDIYWITLIKTMLYVKQEQKTSKKETFVTVKR